MANIFSPDSSRPVFSQELIETENGKHITVFGFEPISEEEKDLKLSAHPDDWFLDRVVDQNKNSN